ncbi:MAG: lipocalin family protein [Luteimonas sp.]
MSRSRFRLLLSAIALTALAACATSPRTGDSGQPALDLQRLMGTWYVIAHVPYFTERGHVASHDEYTLRADGKVVVRYLYRTGFQQPWKQLEAVATVVPGSGNRDWRLRFFRVVPATQRILEVAPDGSWALVATPDRDLAWVFARTPVMDDRPYQELLRRLRGHGVNSDKVWRVPQLPEQVGELGFERPNDP